MLKSLFFLLFYAPYCWGYLRFSEQSCSDLTPRNVDLPRDNPTSPDLDNNGNGIGSGYGQFYGIGTGSNEGIFPWGGSRNRIRNRYGKPIGEDNRIKRSEYADDPPFKVTVAGKRYRRNSDLLG